MGTISCTPLVLNISKVRAKYLPHRIIFRGPKQKPCPLLPTRAQERKCARVSVWTYCLRCDGHDILNASSPIYLQGTCKLSSPSDHLRGSKTETLPNFAYAGPRVEMRQGKRLDLSFEMRWARYLAQLWSYIFTRYVQIIVPIGSSSGVQNAYPTHFCLRGPSGGSPIKKNVYHV